MRYTSRWALGAEKEHLGSWPFFDLARLEILLAWSRSCLIFIHWETSSSILVFISGNFAAVASRSLT